MREVHFNSWPITKRALTWSCDGELAVAADDSVHILIPEFPDPRAAEEASGSSDQQDEEEEDEDEEEEEEDEKESQDPDLVDLRPPFLRRRLPTRQRPQFSGGSLQIPVSYPRLDRRLNADLCDAAGVRSPSGAGDAALSDEDDDDEDEGEDDNDDPDDDDDAGEGSGSESAFSASGDEETDAVGAGPISGAGSGLNHVVSIAWSPIGLGPSGRPVLAVLTSAGVIAIYGDGPASSSPLAAQSGSGGGGLGRVRGEDGMLKRRSLSSWGVLWGVGGRLTVPGQRSGGAGECVLGFAWSRQVAPGRVLLAYINDAREVAVLSVQSLAVPSGGGKEAAAEDAKEKTVWQVQEVARFTAEGPHPRTSVWDPNYVPQGTSFGLRWSPWLLSGDSRSCLLSYIDRNYVGFRRVVINGEPAKGEEPDLTVDEADLYGKCVCLSTDSFVEFEDAIWTKEKSKFVRGLIVTGFHVKPFEATLGGAISGFEAKPHTPEQCDASYSDPQIDVPPSNPIQDLIIHPPNLVKPTVTPIYTLIRLSATSSNHDWHQTNLSLPDNPSTPGGAGMRPRWATDISNKLEISVPAGLHGRDMFAGADGSDSDSDGGRDSDSDGKSGGNEEAYSDSGSEEAGAIIPQGPEVHPHRFRLHGLAASPGGGSSVVLVSAFATQQLDRGGWAEPRSTLIFDSRPRPGLGNDGDGNGDDASGGGGSTGGALRPLTTEGRMWEWMYGGGADVPGITSGVGDGHGSDGAVASKRRRLRGLFQDAIARQRCDFCGDPMETRGMGGLQTVCRKGHFFTTCGTSGLAIQAPGISRTCGACGARTLKLEALVGRAPELEGGIRAEFAGDACGNCGGKFVD